MPDGMADDVSYAEQLWTTDMAGYETWNLFPGTVEYQGSGAPHGDFVRTYVNSIAESDTTSFADGSIIVKRNYQSDTDDNDYDSVTVMKKRDGYVPEAGDWFWVKYEKDGSIAANPDGVLLAGKIGLGSDTGCIPCHDDAAGEDYVFSND